MKRFSFFLKFDWMELWWFSSSTSYYLRAKSQLDRLGRSQDRLLKWEGRPWEHNFAIVIVFRRCCGFLLFLLDDSSQSDTTPYHVPYGDGLVVQASIPLNDPMKKGNGSSYCLNEYTFAFNLTSFPDTPWFSEPMLVTRFHRTILKWLKFIHVTSEDVLIEWLCATETFSSKKIAISCQSLDRMYHR